jgi:uncharacterized heparinase superfamily protein
MASLADQVTYVSASWRNACDGYPRLLALVALVSADLCLCDHDRQLEESQRLLASELERQVLSEGGHLSRNPAVLVELLLDLLPLRQCFAARGKMAAGQLHAAIGTMTAMLRHLRLGDGALARFNGVGTTERDALATVLAYDGHRAATGVRGGYARLERGAVVILADVGPAPPIKLAASACAGCLSLELSTGLEPLLVNAGMPRRVDTERRATARATASHNTLCLGEHSSARLVRDGALERAVGSAPMILPDNVSCELQETEDGAVELRAAHDGYAERFGLLHERTLKLDAAGARLEGCDRLTAAKGIVRFAWDIPFAIHFHLHPDAEARVGPSPEAVELLLDSGEHWRLTATGAAVSIEESTHFAATAGSRRTVQIVFRGQCYGAAEVPWVLERIKAGRAVDGRARRNKERGRSLTQRLQETSAGFHSGDASKEI